MSNFTAPGNSRAFLKTATLFEGSLVLLAYFIAWLADIDPLAELHPDWDSLLWIMAGTLPLYGLLQVAYRLPVRSFRAIKRFLIDQLGPLLAYSHWMQLLYLGLLAGLTEEILFRGVLQPLMESHFGWLVGIVGSNLLFALSHAITPLYALLAGLTGVYLGFALDFGGTRNLLTPLGIHALYDFLAFMAVASSYREEHGMAL